MKYVKIEAKKVSISAPKGTPKKVQNFIVYLCKDGSSRPYEDFERFGAKRLSTVIKNMKWLLNQFVYERDIEKKRIDRIKIFTTFKDNFTIDDKNHPVLDMKIDEFMK